VAVVRRAPEGASDAVPQHVVVGVDGGSSCTAALAFAFRFAALHGLAVTAVHARTPDRAVDLAEREIAFAQQQFAGVPAQARMLCGNPAEVLVRESAGATLVVVGSRGRGSVRAMAFGSVSRSVAEHAPCPVVVVRPTEADGEPLAPEDVGLPDERS
jgi:nucleotide-binding universal stress UspA family protein